MCELASPVQRRHVGDLPTFDAVEEWQGRGMVAVGERHGMCELAFNAAAERRGNGMVCANRPLLYFCTFTEIIKVTNSIKLAH
jgi:hypothetical protein